MEVSVVMCTYNGEKYLAAQLDSILAQTYPLKEILVFDDSSSDNTISILEDYVARHPLISIHRNEHNLGFARNFEQALRSASGDAIAIADQDDVWATSKIGKMVAAWRDDVPLIYCRSVQFRDVVPQYPHVGRNDIRFEGTDGRKLFYYNTVSGHAVMLRRSLLQQVLPFHTGIMYDWWMAVVAAYNGGVQFLPEPLVFHRVHDSNITVTSKQISKKDIVSAHNRQAMEHNEDFLTVPNMPAAHREFANTFLQLLRLSKPGKFNNSLFFFLLKHRHIFFYYKKAGPISHMKHSYRIAKH